MSDPSWSPDGTAIYFKAPEAKTADEKAREKDKDDVYAYDEDYKQTHLWTVNVAARRETRVTTGDYSVTCYDLSADGRKIALHRAPTPLLGSSADGEVWVINADGSGAVQVTKNAVPEDEARAVAGRRAAAVPLGVERALRELLQRPVVRRAAAGGAARIVVGDNEPYDVDRAAWSKDGKSIYFVANLGVHAELFVSAGRRRQAAAADRRQQHAIGSWSTNGDRWAFSISDADQRRRRVGARRAAPPRRRASTHVFDYLARDFKLGRQEAIQWKGADGTMVEGLLTYPVDYVGRTASIRWR